MSRKIVFSRTDLQPHRQYIYDDRHNLVTDARYANYKDYDGISFPSRIEISRPQEEYDITLNMLKLEINKPLRDDQFALQQPPGRRSGASGPAAAAVKRCRSAGRRKVIRREGIISPASSAVTAHDE